MRYDKSKGNGGTVPQILPHVAPYNHYFSHTKVVFVGIYLGYSLKGTQLFPLNKKPPFYQPM